MKITVKMCIKNDACYSAERIEELLGADGLTPREVAALDIPYGDRLWALKQRELWGENPERDLRLFACLIAEDVLPIFEAKHPHDTRPREAIETARRYAVGDPTDEQELATAWRASMGAARAAAMAAAGGAAWDAAWAAAWAAARDATGAAAGAAAGAAGASAKAARNAARDKYIGWAVEIVESKAGGASNE